MVDAGMRKVQCVTIFLLAFLALAMAAALVRSIKLDLRFVLAEQEEALHRESTERQKMEDLANTDGLTGLFQREILQQRPCRRRKKAAAAVCAVLSGSGQLQTRQRHLRPRCGRPAAQGCGLAAADLCAEHGLRVPHRRR